MMDDQNTENEKKMITIKKDIRSLLISSPVGLNIQSLLDDYRSMLGRQLPFQELGYSSALEMIKRMPDVVIPVFRGGVMYLKAVADNSTKHILRLVEEQKRTGRISRIRKPANEAVRRPPIKPSIPYTVRAKIKELLKSYPGGLEADMFGTAYIRRFGLEINYGSLGFPSLKKFLESCSDIIDIVEQEKNGIKSISLYPKNGENAKIANGTLPVSNASRRVKVASPVKRRINATLDSQRREDKKGLSPTPTSSKPPVSKLLPKSSAQNHPVSSAPRSSVRYTAPPISSLPKSSVSSASSSNKCPGNRRYFDSVGPNMPSLMDLDVDHKKGPLTQNSTGKEAVIKTKSGVSKELKEQLSSLLAEKKNGVWLARIPFEYKKKFSKDLDFKSMGYVSLIEMVGSIPGTVRLERPVKDGDWLLHAAVGASKTSAVNASPEDPLPQNAVISDGKFQKISHPKHGQIRIFIVHITDPGSFCFHWHDKRNDLEELMENMRIFYTSVSSQKYILPSSLKRVGQVCCSIYDEDEEWYRAEITKVISEKQVEVFYVDYGNLAIVETSNVRLLKNDFIGLPSMAIQGSLTNILPKGTLSWPIEAGRKFFEMANDRVLVANICGYVNQTVSLHLIDTNSKQQVHINDTLVTLGMAIYKNPVVPDVNPTVPLPVNTQSYPPNMPLNLEALKQGLSSFNAVTANAFLPLLLRPQQPGQSFVGGQNTTAQSNLASLFSNLLAGNMPATANPKLTPTLEQQLTQQTGLMNTMIPPNRQGSSDTPENKDDFDSFIEAVNCELDAEISDENQSEADDAELVETEPCYTRVRRLFTPDPYILNAIEIDRKPYLSSGEIAALFWHGDILRSMLRREKIEIGKAVISQDENKELFEEMIQNDVSGVSDANGIKTHITVYELDSLPKVLDLFKHKSVELKETVEKEINQYRNDPENYWLDACTDDDDVDDDDEEDLEDSESYELELEELRLLLQAMQFRRKRLVNSLVNKEPSPSAVDELKDVEDEIERIRKKVMAKEGIVAK